MQAPAGRGQDVLISRLWRHEDQDLGCLDSRRDIGSDLDARHQSVLFATSDALDLTVDVDAGCGSQCVQDSPAGRLIRHDDPVAGQAKLCRKRKCVVRSTNDRISSGCLNHLEVL